MPVPFVRIPDQHQLPVPDHPDDETGVARAITASFGDAHRVLAVLDQVLDEPGQRSTTFEGEPAGA